MYENNYIRNINNLMDILIKEITELKFKIKYILLILIIFKMKF